MKDEDIRRWLGRRIRELRTERRLSQEALAEKAGLTTKHLGRIERGETDTSVTTLVRIALGLDVSVGELFGRITPQPVFRVPPDALRALRDSIGSLNEVVSELTRGTGEPSETIARLSRRARRSQNRK